MGYNIEVLFNVKKNGSVTKLHDQVREYAEEKSFNTEKRKRNYSEDETMILNAIN